MEHVLNIAIFQVFRKEGASNRYGNKKRDGTVGIVAHSRMRVQFGDSQGLDFRGSAYGPGGGSAVTGNEAGLGAEKQAVSETDDRPVDPRAGPVRIVEDLPPAVGIGGSAKGCRYLQIWKPAVDLNEWGYWMPRCFLMVA